MLLQRAAHHLASTFPSLPRYSHFQNVLPTLGMAGGRVEVASEAAWLKVVCGFCSWLALTDPRDVARIESKTVIITREQRDTVPIPKSGPSQLGRWMSEEDFEKAFDARFPGCMKGEQGICWIGQLVAKLLLLPRAGNAVTWPGRAASCMCEEAWVAPGSADSPGGTRDDSVCTDLRFWGPVP